LSIAKGRLSHDEERTGDVSSAKEVSHRTGSLGRRDRKKGVTETLIRHQGGGRARLITGVGDPQTDTEASRRGNNVVVFKSPMHKARIAQRITEIIRGGGQGPSGL